MSLRVENVVFAPENILLVLEDGDEVRISLEGDCCSESHFDDDTKLDAKDLLGQQLRAIRVASSGPDTPYPDGGAGLSRHYFLIIQTDQGDTTLAWRNDSNGYYDGHVEVTLNGKDVFRSDYSPDNEWWRFYR